MRRRARGCQLRSTRLMKTRLVRLGSVRSLRVLHMPTKMKDDEFDLVAFTDGAASVRSNLYGLAYTIIDNRFEDRRVVESIGVTDTTSNRMELLSILLTLSSIRNKRLKVRIYSDSMYCVRSINEWMWTWEEVNMFKKNEDLFKRMIEEIVKFDTFPDLRHVKGHSGNELNEFVDRLAVNVKKQGPWFQEKDLLTRSLKQF